MMTKEERCRLALGYHRQHYNCGQSVLGAFRDLTGLTEEQCWGLGSGLGSGMRCGGICGAVSGGVLVLGWLTPHTDGADAEGKKRTYAAVKEFRRRFEEVFGLTRCADLLAAHPQPGEKNPAALRLGVTAHCDNMIVTAVEILEKMLAERTAD